MTPSARWGPLAAEHCFVLRRIQGVMLEMKSSNNTEILRGDRRAVEGEVRWEQVWGVPEVLDYIINSFSASIIKFGRSSLFSQITRLSLEASIKCTMALVNISSR